MRKLFSECLTNASVKLKLLVNTPTQSRIDLYCSILFTLNKNYYVKRTPILSPLLWKNKISNWNMDMSLDDIFFLVFWDYDLLSTVFIRMSQSTHALKILSLKHKAEQSYLWSDDQPLWLTWSPVFHLK